MMRISVGHRDGGAAPGCDHARIVAHRMFKFYLQVSRVSGSDGLHVTESSKFRGHNSGGLGLCPARKPSQFGPAYWPALVSRAVREACQ